MRDVLFAELIVAALLTAAFFLRYLYTARLGNSVSLLLAAWAGWGFAELVLLVLTVAGVRIYLWVPVVFFGLVDVFTAWRLIVLVRIQDGGDMASWVYGALRTGAQALWGWLAIQLAGVGISLPDWTHNWFVETLGVAGGIALVTAGVRWLETRKGDSFAARAARWAASVIMLGLSGKQPVYTSPVPTASPETVTFADSRTRPTLKE